MKMIFGQVLEDSILFTEAIDTLLNFNRFHLDLTKNIPN